MVCKLKYYLLIFSAVFCVYNTQGQQASPRLKNIKEAPFELQTYTLDNGLQLYFAPNDGIPTIRTSIAIKAGSEQEPDETTGLAHYLEHLLFKGTDQLGSLDFEQEAPLLEGIEMLFEKYRAEKDSSKRKNIFAQIDSLSLEASKYSNGQEYTELMVSMGIGFLNAYTNVNRTVYFNSIPSNQLKKWFALEAERFRNPQFRTFHTELETVYEELNAIMDDHFRYHQIQLIEALFREEDYDYKHPIGKVDHLKNPSIKAVKAFYKKYYVPNNMAILLAGNFDVEEALKYAKDYFGHLSPKALPPRDRMNLQPLPAIRKEYVHVPDQEMLMMGYRFNGYGSREALLMEFVEMMLLNGSAGLFDLNIINQRAVNFLSTKPVFHRDFSVHVISANPKENQSLEEVKAIVLDEIEKVKNGDFPDWLIDATKSELKKRYMSSLTSNGGKIGLLEDAFINDSNLKNHFDKRNQFDQLSKEDIIEFVQQHYVNYSIVFGRPSIKSKEQKIRKPDISSLKDNSGKASAFAKSLKEFPTTSVQYEAIHFAEKISDHTLGNNAKMFYCENKTNDLFNLKLVFAIQKTNPYTPIVEQFLKKGSTLSQSRKELQQALFRLGAKVSVYSNATALMFQISGLSENLDATCALINDLFKNVKADDEILQAIKDQIKQDRNLLSSSKSQLMRHAIKTVLYSADTASAYMLTDQQLAAISSEGVATRILNLLNTPYECYFYGKNPKKEVIKILNKRLTGIKNIPKLNLKNPHPVIRTAKDKVYLKDFSSKNVDLVFLSKLKDYDSDLDFMAYLFRNYFEKILFTELRESRGLAYTTSCVFQIPHYPNKPFFFYPRVTVPYDKYQEAIEITIELIRKMPLREEIFENSKQRLLNSWRSHKIIDDDQLYWYERRKNQSLDTDPFDTYIQGLEPLSFEDFIQFYEEWIKENPIETILVGDLDELSLPTLKQFGELEVLSFE